MNTKEDLWTEKNRSFVGHKPYSYQCYIADGPGTEISLDRYSDGGYDNSRNY